jgi:hypothetical protein
VLSTVLGQARVVVLDHRRFLVVEVVRGVAGQLLQRCAQLGLAVALPHGIMQVVRDLHELLVLHVDKRHAPAQGR